MADVFVNKRSYEFVSNPGNPLVEKFHGVQLPSGEIVLKSDGFENIQDYINSFKAETDIYNIIQRVNAGELDLLNAKQGAYVDVTKLPKNYAEVLQTVIDAQRTFDQLPDDIKEKFGYSFKTWFEEMDNDDFLVKTGFVEPVKEKIVDEEVKSDE